MNAIRATMAAGTAAAASAAGYFQMKVAELRNREDLAGEFLDARPQQLASDMVVSTNGGGGCGCNGNRSEPAAPLLAMAIPSGYQKPSLFNTILDVMHNVAVRAVLDGEQTTRIVPKTYIYEHTS